MDNEEVMKSVMPMVLGGIAGIISYIIALGNISRDPLGIIVLVFAIYANKFILPKLDVKKIKPTDWLLIAAISFTSWYMIWTFLMNI